MEVGGAADLRQWKVAVTESSQIGEARRLAENLAAQADLDATQRGRVGVVTTELATNLVRHARAGELILRRLEAPRGVEVLSLDAGPGIPNLERALVNGYSTFGSSGDGLGAVRRMSDQFDAYSTPAGTAVLARIFASSPPAAEADRIGVVSLPLAGESACGDAWAAEPQNDGANFMLIDGLGHGPLAADAAAHALAVFRAHPHHEPSALLELTHGALQGTRGAAAAFARIERGPQRLRFVGVGNISASVLCDGARQNAMSHHGIVGHAKIRIQEQTLSWPSRARLVLHSDGLSARWSLAGTDRLYHHDPAIVAGVLFRNYKRDNDDATVLVAC